MDTEYSNEQDGVRIKIINLDSESPYIRIENKKKLTLAIRNNFTFGVTFKINNEKIKRTLSADPFKGSSLRKRESEDITILTPGSNLEIPMVRLYFNYGEDGHGEFEEWKTGMAKMPIGKYTVFFSSNAANISALDLNISPFRVNFDIPEIEIVLK